MASVGYPAEPDDRADLLIGEARQRQRRRWWFGTGAALCLAGIALAVVLIGRGGGSGGRPATLALSQSAPTVTRVGHPTSLVSGSLTVTFSAQRRFGQAVRPTVSDTGLLVNRGRHPVYIDGRPLILSLQPLLPHERFGTPRYYALRVHGPFHLAGVFMSGSRSVFVLATTKRPPTSLRDVPGRKIAVWYTLDGGDRWQTNVQTITKPSHGALLTTAVPALQGTDEKTAVTRLLGRGLVPGVKIVTCPGCSTPTGRVFKQVPAAGRRATRWSVVRIEVAGS